MFKSIRLGPIAVLALALLATACSSTPNDGWQANAWVDDAQVNDLTALGHMDLSNGPKGSYP